MRIDLRARASPRFHPRRDPEGGPAQLEAGLKAVGSGGSHCAFDSIGGFPGVAGFAGADRFGFTDHVERRGGYC